MTEQLIKDLQRVKTLIEAGWIQKRGCAPREGGGWSYCLVGAIETATDGWMDQEKSRFKRTTWAVYRALKEGMQDTRHTHSDPGRGLICWNDQFGRNQDQVIDLINLTIGRELRGEGE